MPEIQVPELNEEQEIAILTESLARGLYEVQDGAIPTDPVRRSEDAKALVTAAIRAKNNKNNSDAVNTILFIALTDQKPLSYDNGSQIDVSTVSDDILDQLIVKLDTYVDSPAVQAERVAFLAEKERRAANVAKEEIPQAAAQGEGAEKSAEIGPEVSPTPSPIPSQITTAATGPNQGTDSSSGTDTGSDSSTGEDAGSFARVQAVTEDAEGKDTPGQSPAEDGASASLIEQIDFNMVKAHGVDPAKIEKLTDYQLQYIVDNPTGPKPGESVQTILPHKAVGNIVAGIDQTQAPPLTITKENLDTIASAKTDSIREELESQVTGPMLKAYKQGRQDVPNMGDNFLRLMVQNPEARITQEQYNEAIAADQKTKEEILPPLDFGAVSETPQLDLSKIKPVVPQEVPVYLVPETVINEPQEKTITQIAQEHAAKAIETEDPPTITKDVSPSDVIIRENLPIAPEIDGETPVLPPDVSKCSKDEIYSLHARFHATEVRANVLISNYEDKKDDARLLRKSREVEVINSLPEDRKLTNDQREALAAADPTVKGYAAEEHELMKYIRKLKVIRDNDHLSCERLSRQMSKFEMERRDGPR